MKNSIIGIMLLTSVPSFASSEVPGNLVVDGKVGGHLTITSYHFTSAQSKSIQLTKHCVASLHNNPENVAPIPLRDYKVINMKSYNTNWQDGGFAWTVDIAYELQLDDSIINKIKCRKTRAVFLEAEWNQATYSRFKSLWKKVGSANIQAL